jgi:hypothetical protein
MGLFSLFGAGTVIPMGSLDTIKGRFGNGKPRT